MTRLRSSVAGHSSAPPPRELGDAAGVGVADEPGQRLRPQAPALAGRARPLAHVALDVLADVVRRGLAVVLLEPGDHAFPLHLVGPPLARAVLVAEAQRGLHAVEG